MQRAVLTRSISTAKQVYIWQVRFEQTQSGGVACRVNRWRCALAVLIGCRTLPELAKCLIRLAVVASA